MTYDQQELRDIELNTIKEEKNFDFRTLLINLFKALHDLFTRKKNISKEELINVAEQESKKLGIQGHYDWNKVFDERELSNKEQTSISQESENSYPKNFYVEKSIANGSCFFDSFKQSLFQQKNIVVSVEQLRKDCQEFALSTTIPKWFERAIKDKSKNGNNEDYILNLGEYKESIPNHTTWGDPDIEGRVLCAKYGVKLHVIEANPWYESDKKQDEFLHQIIGGKGNLNLDNDSESIIQVKYDDDTIVHVINLGRNHFEPLLDKSKPMLKNIKNLQQEQADLELAKKLQIQEDLMLAKDLQVEEILEYLNINKNNTLYQATKLKIGNVLNYLMNTPQKDTRPLCQVVDDLKLKYLDTTHSQISSHPSCNMQEINILQPLSKSQQTVR
ncbi:MAG: hypothetical protein KTV77_03160 [Wolbachia endosymbiont of Fragariocoptes setiger]|nr:hypothetical protein [Wolbachia endosymbiont of Fragariocoptes setiger]